MQVSTEKVEINDKGDLVMSHRKSINKRLAAEKANGAVEKDITGTATNAKSKSKKNK